MTGRGLNDDELRDAAAGRPGYATYPQYRPGQRERLGKLPAVAAAPTFLLTTARRMTVDDGRAIKMTLRGGVRIGVQPPPVRMIDARPATSTVPPDPATLESLPPSRVFDFQPDRSPARPWWLPRWHWAVLTATGGLRHGYAWTEAGAARRTARAARRAAR